MATFKFLLQSKSKTASIYVRLSKGRGNTFYQKTGLIIDANEWSKATDLPKQNSSENKNLSTQLRDLQNTLIKELNKAEANGTLIDSKWLKRQIDIYFGRVQVSELHYLVNYGEHFINELQYRVTDKGVKGVSTSTEKKYRTIVNKLIEFEKKSKKRYLITDVDLSFRTDLIKFFSNSNKLNDNTIGRYLKFVKSICLDAQKNGFQTNPQLAHFKGFTVKAEKIILSFNEFEKIKKANLLKEAHKIARDWLLIGCYTGQRVSDLLRMNKSFIQNIQSFDFIVLEQIKTKKLVQIPLHQEVKDVLNKYEGNFPPLFTKNMDSNKAMFNSYLKELCKIAGIDEVVTGSCYDEEKKRNVIGEYEKHKLVSSHICRRSFATNFYGNPIYPTPLLMNITAHGTEKMFLEYIGKKPIDYGLQLAQIWAKEAIKEKQKQNTQLEVIKNVVNN